MNEEIGIILNYTEAVIKRLNPKEKQNTWLKNNYLGIFIFRGTGKEIVKKYGLKVLISHKMLTETFLRIKFNCLFKPETIVLCDFC